MLRFNPIAKNSFRVFLRSDQAILMLCIIIAFVFWLATKLSYPYKSSIQIKLAYTLPEKKTFSQIVPEFLEADIQATGWDLLFFTLPDFKIDLNNQQQLFFSSNNLVGLLQKSLPLGTQLLQIRPDNLNLQMEEMSSKIVPIQLDLQVELAPQHKLADSPTVVPATVEILGAVSVLKNIKVWKTTSIILQQLKSTHKQTIDLQTAGDKNIFISPKKVNLEIKVEQVTEKKVEIPLTMENLPDSVLLLLLPNKIMATCVVGLNDYARLNSSEFKAVVDFNKKNEDNSLHIRLEKRPNYVDFIQFQPKKVNFVIKKIK
jgi:YbbR-like protein